MNLDDLTGEERAKILLGLELLAIRQERIHYGDPKATRELRDRLSPRDGVVLL